eukprot:TRINITY_DN47655_c0_g1_i1.p1 TRINITY_DN47655_c0_g1~~TRINITY_DN47655_c0_g1_i1.p1  ORF type:complete len:223 (+),score=21.20 TRINITY_DN47655_c0_g1_i1:59-727(+)
MPSARCEPLPIADISDLRLPLDSGRFDHVPLDDLPDKEFPNPPNELVPIGEIRWLQDSAYDSFSDEHATSIWQTLLDIVAGRQTIYRSRSAPSGIPTIMCHKAAGDGHWYSLDTRRTLIFKLAFHPDQGIPVHAVPQNKLVNLKMASHRWSSQRASSVWLKLRMHRAVPRGLLSQSFIRNSAELAYLEAKSAEDVKSSDAGSEIVLSYNEDGEDFVMDFVSW